MNAKLSTAVVILGLALGLAVGFDSTASADVTIPGMGSGAYDVPSVGGPGDQARHDPGQRGHRRRQLAVHRADPGAIIRRGPETPTSSFHLQKLSHPSACPSTCPRALWYPVALSEGECLRKSSSPTAAR